MRMKIRRRFKNGIRRKLGSQCGETIAETLVALLVSTLALVMLAGAIGAAANVITRSNAKMAEYYTKDAAVAGQSGTPVETISVSLSEGGVPVQSWTARWYLNDTFGNVHVAAYAPEGG